ncbi:hypothetical protein SAMN02745227_01127 [Anaerobranca californiensis DSM 14826]|uniref:Uncharacterized protein n=2 Tax=Anaerobranca TaxID=42447 RepID=A0A1M6NHL6_9FIRM|nr:MULTISPECIES: hypothetical protein [Anaerobranca]SES66244.1 hypothetical protein SAMN03080614_100282 [Anaerobranca gottschalkii DSM 13577]SHJ95132.1 hypothetical protein SAMN02745227_01127 [Anaerobranca californiensis DSM 14826]
MDCVQCGNCTLGERTYYCIKEGGFVINPKYVCQEKKRIGWKKEDFRRVRKEKEAQKA